MSLKKGSLVEIGSGNFRLHGLLVSCQKKNKGEEYITEVIFDVEISKTGFFKHRNKIPAYRLKEITENHFNYKDLKLKFKDYFENAEAINQHLPSTQWICHEYTDVV